MQDAQFRENLLQQCKQASELINESFLSYFRVPTSTDESNDDLEAALKGTANDDGSLPATKWATFDIEDDFVFEEKLLLPPSTVNVQGQYSRDLDLFFKREDYISLFDFQMQNYKELCELSAQALRNYDDAGALRKVEAKLMARQEFNYLSEDDTARSLLYYVCTLDDETMDENAAQLLSENAKKFHLLYQ